MERGGVLIAGIVAVGLWAADGAGAKTFEVTRTVDTAPNGCDQGGCTLREAIIAANDRAGADEIVLRSRRTYTLAVPGMGEDLAAAGDLDVLGPTTIRASKRGRATIDANGLDNVFHAFANVAFTRIVVTDGLIGIIQTGSGGVAGSDLRVTDNTGIGIDEAGDGGVVLRRSVVSGNLSTGVQEFDDGSVSVVRIQATDNGSYGVFEAGEGNLTAPRARSAENGSNGLLEFNDGDLSAPGARVLRNEATGIQETHAGNLNIAGARVTGNDSAGAFEVDDGSVSASGARIAGNQSIGIQETNPGNLDLNRARVLNNLVDGAYEFEEGALRATRAKFAGNGGSGLQEFNEGPLVLSRSSVTGNDDSGVQVFGPGGGRIVRSTIARNATGGLGGGLFTDDRVVVRDSTIGRNAAVQGGGIFMTIGSELVITNSTVASNESDDDGGGIYAADTSNVELNAVTVVRNVAGNGGGLYLEGPNGAMRVDNSLIALNDAVGLLLTGDDCVNEDDPFDSGGNNLLSDESLCEGFDAPGDLVRANPKIGQLSRNGGPTETVALKPGSPAIGKAGNDAPGRDQRGRKRDNRPDSGAFER